MHIASVRLFLVLLATIVLLCVQSAFAGGWVSPWSGTQSLVTDAYTPQVAFAEDGSFFIGGGDGAVTRLSRLNSAGQLIWTRQIGVDGSYGVSQFFPGKSGDIIYLTPYGNLGRIDPSGNSVWLHPALPGSSAVVADAQYAYTAACTPAGLLVVAKLDRLTGVSRRQTVANSSSFCLSPGAVIDSLGNLYVHFYESNKARLVKIGVDGELLWTQPNVLGAAGKVLIATPDRLYVYVYSEQRLKAIDTADGSNVWTYVDTPSGFLTIGQDLVLTGVHGLVRLDGGSGKELWVVQENGYLVPHVAGNKLVLISQYEPKAITIDATSGAEDPAHTLDKEKGHVLAADFLDGSTLSILAEPTSAPAPSGLPPVRMYRWNFVDDAVAPTIDLAQQPLSIIGTHVPDFSGDAIGAGYSAAAPSTVHVRRVRIGDGSEAWHVNQSIADPYLTIRSVGVAPVGNSVVTSVTETYGGGSQYGAGKVMAFDKSTGALRWSVPLMQLPYGQGNTQVFDPVDDGAGNPIVGMYAEPIFGPTDRRPTRSIIKFDKTDGHILWRRDVPAMNRNQYSPLSLVGAGGYLIAEGDFDTPVDQTRIVGLSMADGSPQWHSSSFPSDVYESLSVDASHVAVIAGGALAKMAVPSGDQDSIQFADYSICVPYCQEYAFIALADGSLLDGGEIWGSHLPYLGIGTGSAGTPSLTVLDVPGSGRRGAVTSAYAEASGGATIRINRRASFLGFYSYAKLDGVTKKLEGEQVSSERLYDPGIQGLVGRPIRRIDPSHMLQDGFAGGGTGSAGSVAALVDTHVAADGDLSVVVSTPSSVASPQHPLLFDAKVRYTGTAPLDGVTLSLALPPNTGAIVLQCTGSGQHHCVLDTQGVATRAHFSLASGDTLDLSGQFTPTPRDETPAAAISAVVFGPIGLRETDTTNNLNQAAVTVGMFADGFDVP